MNPDFYEKKNLGVEILGTNGSKMDFFGSFSKTSLRICFLFRLEEDIMVSAKFEV